MIPLTGDPTPRPVVTAAGEQGMASLAERSLGRLLLHRVGARGGVRRSVPRFRTPVTWQIFTRGGYWPSWRADGREIIYLDFAGTITTVPVETHGDALTRRHARRRSAPASEVQQLPLRRERRRSRFVPRIERRCQR